MNEEIKTRWVTALRSGEYRQGTGQLTWVPLSTEARPMHCCLGVLCELAVADGVVTAVQEENMTRLYDGEDNYLPASVRVWAEVDRNPQVRVRAEERDGDGLDSEPHQVNLAVLNDGEDGWDQRSFDEIAQLIEEHL